MEEYNGRSLFSPSFFMSCGSCSSGSCGPCGSGCGGCKALIGIVALLTTFTTIAALVGVYSTHMTADGLRFGTVDGSLAIVALLVSMMCWLKLVKKLCPCGKACGADCGACGTDKCGCK